MALGPNRGGEPLLVYYDGACPVCRREIGWLRARADGVAFDDVAGRPQDPAPDLTRQAALARFHVRRADGTLLSGAGAFLEVWSRVPALRLLRHMQRAPWLVALLDRAYTTFLSVRRRWRRPAT